MRAYILHKSFSDNYKNHQMVKEVFPGDGKVLFQNNGSKLLILSEANLDSKFSDSILLEDLGDVEQYIDRCEDECTVSIRLNPVKANKRKKFPIRSDELDDWIKKKFQEVGLDILEANIINEGVVVSERHGEFCYHSSTLVQARCKVLDRRAFSEAVRNGIGKGKAFGFGALNIF